MKTLKFTLVTAVAGLTLLSSCLEGGPAGGCDKRNDPKPAGTTTDTTTTNSITRLPL